jgi:hypothetical protein
MKRAAPLNGHDAPWTRAIAVVLLGLGLASCADHSPTIPEAEYSTTIVGRWQGTVGDFGETMAIAGNGTFVCHLHPLGFIAKTLSQSVTGTIRGTWKITGATMTLTITGAEAESLRNRVAESTILAFKKDALVLKSDHGETSLFRRASAF